MKAMKKLIAISLVVVMLFALAVPAVAWIYDPNHIETKADANSTNLIASPDEEIVLNAGKLPENATVVLGGEESDENWKYAYPFQLDKLFTPGKYDSNHHTDLYFMWDENYLYIKEYHRDELNLPDASATAVNGNYDAVEYNIVGPGLAFGTQSSAKAVGLVIDIFPTMTETGVSENRVMTKTINAYAGDEWSSGDYSGVTGNGSSVSGNRGDATQKADGVNQNVVSYGRLLDDGTWELETAVTWKYLDAALWGDPFANVAVNMLLGFKHYASIGGSASYHTINSPENGYLNGTAVSDISYHNVYDYFAPMYLRDVDAKASEQLIDISWYNRHLSSFNIETAGQLRGLSYITNQYVNYRNHYSSPNKNDANGLGAVADATNGKTFNIAADIDLNPNWSVDDDVPPLYVWYDIAGFAGTLNGNGYTISGFCTDGVWNANKMKMSNVSGADWFFDVRRLGSHAEATDTVIATDLTRDRGFIGVVYAGTVNVNNIIFENCKVVCRSNNSGGIVGLVKGAGVTIKNVYADIDMDSNVGGNNWSYTGGIIGKIENGKATITENIVCVGDFVCAGNSGIDYGCAPIWASASHTSTSAENKVEDILVIRGKVNNLKNYFTVGGNRSEVQVVTLNTDGTLNGASNVALDDYPDHWVNVDEGADVNGTLVKMPPEVAAMVGRSMQVQRSNKVAGETSFKIRVLTVFSTLEWEKLDYKVEIANGSSWTEVTGLDFSTTTVYSSVDAAGAKVTAEELGGKYITGMYLSGIPASGTVTLRVTPIYHWQGNTYTGAAANITYVNGVFTR